MLILRFKFVHVDGTSNWRMVTSVTMAEAYHSGETPHSIPSSFAWHTDCDINGFSLAEDNPGNVCESRRKGSNPSIKNMTKRESIDEDDVLAKRLHAYGKLVASQKQAKDLTVLHQINENLLEVSGLPRDESEELLVQTSSDDEDDVPLATRMYRELERQRKEKEGSYESESKEINSSQINKSRLLRSLGHSEENPLDNKNETETIVIDLVDTDDDTPDATDSNQQNKRRQNDSASFLNTAKKDSLSPSVTSSIKNKNFVASKRQWHICRPRDAMNAGIVQPSKYVRSPPVDDVPNQHKGDSDNRNGTAKSLNNSSPAKLNHASVFPQKPFSINQRRVYVGVSSNGRLSHAIGHKKSLRIKNKAKEIDQLAEQIWKMSKASRATEKDKAQKAWKNAAMAWRQKNKPSAAEIDKTQAEIKRQKSNSSYRQGHFPRSRLFCNTEFKSSKLGADSQSQCSGNCGDHRNLPSLLPRPKEGDPEADWRAYFRSFHQYKVLGQGHGSFENVLKTFNISLTGSSKLKDGYRMAVRMYHPDSNSQDRVWRTPLEKAEAEEIMKIINERKPPDLG